MIEPLPNHPFPSPYVRSAPRPSLSFPQVPYTLSEKLVCVLKSVCLINIHPFHQIYPTLEPVNFVQGGSLKGPYSLLQLGNIL